MLRHTFLSLICFCSLLSFAQNQAYNNLKSYIRSENGKYGIASETGDWLVKAQYDTIFERRIFPYEVAVPNRTELQSANIVFVSVNFPGNHVLGDEAEFHALEI